MEIDDPGYEGRPGRYSGIVEFGQRQADKPALRRGYPISPCIRREALGNQPSVPEQGEAACLIEKRYAFQGRII
jgi:hypothetical protein